MKFLEILKDLDKATVVENKRLRTIYARLLKEAKADDAAAAEVTEEDLTEKCADEADLFEEQDEKKNKQPADNGDAAKPTKEAEGDKLTKEGKGFFEEDVDEVDDNNAAPADAQTSKAEKPGKDSFFSEDDDIVPTSERDKDGEEDAATNGDGQSNEADAGITLNEFFNEEGCEEKEKDGDEDGDSTPPESAPANDTAPADSADEMEVDEDTLTTFADAMDSLKGGNDDTPPTGNQHEKEAADFFAADQGQNNSQSTSSTSNSANEEEQQAKEPKQPTTEKEFDKFELDEDDGDEVKEREAEVAESIRRFAKRNRKLFND